MAGRRDLLKGSLCHRKTWINVILGILQLLLSCLQHGGAQLPALTQVSNVVEVLQAEDVDFLVPSQAEEEHNKENLPQEESSSFYRWESGRPLQFQPPALEFGTQPLGLPRAETIYIHNPSPELPVTVLSIFTSSRHFHIPPFHRKEIPPRGKASFKLTFFPTEEGNVENSLFINTSTHGVLPYQVFGVGIPGGSQQDGLKDSLVISPHIKSIKLTQTQEDASNITILGLMLDCSLPKNVFSHPQGWCFVVEEEEVASLSLLLSLSEKDERQGHLDKLKTYVTENLMVLFLIPALSSARAPRIDVFILNSGAKKLFVKDIQLLSKTESSLDFMEVQLSPSSTNFTHVSTLSCKRSPSGPERTCPSQISVQLLGNSSIRGSPYSNRWGMDLASLFQLRQTRKGSDVFDVWFNNLLGLPFTITNISFAREPQSLLKVVGFNRSIANPSSCWKLFSLQFFNRTSPVNLISLVVLQSQAGFSLLIPMHIFTTVSKLGDVLFDTGVECTRPCSFRLSRAGQVEWQHSLLPHSTSKLWAIDNSLAMVGYSPWLRRRDQLPCRWPRLHTQTSSNLDFGATPVNESKLKSLTLKNPSASVVSVEVRPLSLYPSPLKALDVLSKWFSMSHLSVNVTTMEFGVLPTAPQEGEGFLQGPGGAVQLLLQPWESKTVAVVYTPLEHRPITSVLLIRNNLSVFDMVTVRGLGAKELLRIGGKLPGPGASLRFNIPQSTLMECRDGVRSKKPLFAIRKTFKVENTGELPLTIMAMSINGYKCQGFGFEVLQCAPFTLDYNSSTDVTIVFTPDFTSSWVIRDLTVVTARGSSFPFTLNVTLPHHMLPLCAQVMPGPSWEESFWMVTLVFTCFSLAGVCLMAFHQAQYILSEFTSSSHRSNHNSHSRENATVSNISSHSVSKGKASCKTYTDPCQTSEKGKGRSTAAVANGQARNPSSSKKNSGGLPQQKKPKVSILYGKYKPSSNAHLQSMSATTPSSTLPLSSSSPSPSPLPRPISPVNEEQLHEQACEPSMSACHSNRTSSSSSQDNLEEGLDLLERRAHPSVPRERETLMFPMETCVVFPENSCPLPAFNPSTPPNMAPEGDCTFQLDKGKRERAEIMESLQQSEGHTSQRKNSEWSEASVQASNFKSGKKTCGKGRRKDPDTNGRMPGVSVVVLSEQREPRGGPRGRNHHSCIMGGVKPDLPKTGASLDCPVKQNGACQARSRRKCPERRPAHWESGSDSSSGGSCGGSSGRVRASRGSWGSWSSTSSMEGDSTTRQHCANPARKRDHKSNSVHPLEQEQNHLVSNPNYKSQSVNRLYRKEKCQSPDPTPPVPRLVPSFATVAGRADRSIDVPSSYVPEETWSAPSVPLTNEFRYNMTESFPFVPQNPALSHYHGFPWSGVNSQCSSTYNPYNNQSTYTMGGNTHFKSAISCHENQPAAYSHQPVWGEGGSQEPPSSWDMTGYGGSKSYFPGTRSLSPMSSLFGSIWTPQSEPYQSHFQQQERSAPTSPHNMEPGVGLGGCAGRGIGSGSSSVRGLNNNGCQVAKQYSSFNPFGPHMNLDIWGTTSSRSSNSQLSNDSGYCGDI